VSGDDANSEKAGQDKQQGWRPVPDPTVLTTEALQREIANLRELLGARMDQMDAATELRLEALLKIPAETAALIQHLEALHDEKFRSIELQFKERDIRGDQANRASKEALDAALLAAKELVGATNLANAAAAKKSEDNFTKQIDQIMTLIVTQGQATDARITEQGKTADARVVEVKERIDELKERIDRASGMTEGGQVQRVETRQQSVETRQQNGLWIAFGGLALTGLVVAISIISLVLANRP
jgi:hypothetical protein